jgi:hypothetical protein
MSQMAFVIQPSTVLSCYSLETSAVVILPLVMFDEVGGVQMWLAG